MVHNVALPRVHVFNADKELVVLGLSIRSIVDQRRADALGQSVVAWVGEVVTGVSLTWRMSFCYSVVGGDPHGWGVGDCGHGGLFSFLFLAVDDEEQEEEDDQ